MSIEEIIRAAFFAGESWGVTYSTWFTPSKEDTERKIQEAIKSITDNTKEEVK
jgi:hypothetical protein